MPDHPVPVSRREVLCLLAAGALMPSRFVRQENQLEFTGLDHIEFYASNAEKARDFYVRIFGNTLRRRGAKRYLKLGSTYMAFAPPRSTGSEIKVDHFSVSIKSLDMTKLHTSLENRGVAYQDYPSGRDTGVNDPDGIRLQLSPENGWDLLNPDTFRAESVALDEEPIFRPTGLDHILLNVTDTEKSVKFYERILGPARPGNNNRIWFQAGTSRIGLLKTPAGQPAGVNHFCVSAEPFNYDGSVQRLQRIGAKVEPPEVAGAPEFRNSDGLLMQVIART
jgi:catechol 2,3-dioxygenase-like lactoylglutathione lyase family enzyme